MNFSRLFGDIKPVIGMIHTNHSEQSTLETAIREIEIYLKYGIFPLIENYFGSVQDCEDVLKWIQVTHPDAIYGLNILGDYEKAFALSERYGAKFIQIDSVCGHLKPENEPSFVQKLNECRNKCDVVVLGGVRFKYQNVRSGRSVKEDLLLGMERCDAIVCTGTGTGVETPIDKVNYFKATIGDFPVIVGAGVTLETVKETYSRADGAIVGSWFKLMHDALYDVEESNVKVFMEALG